MHVSYRMHATRPDIDVGAYADERGKSNDASQCTIVVGNENVLLQSLRRTIHMTQARTLVAASEGSLSAHIGTPRIFSLR